LARRSGPPLLGGAWITSGTAGFILAAGSVAAQGVAGAALRGTVTGLDSKPLAQSQVEVTNLTNGARWLAVPQVGGLFFVENLTVGGPYRVVAKAIGFIPDSTTGIVVGLGQRLVLTFKLRPLAARLAPIVVQAGEDPRINAGRTGPADAISGDLLNRLPARQRDFTLLALVSPQVTLSPTGGLSFGGQLDRLNGLQIDGATNNDLFGGQNFGPNSGSVGSFGNARSLPLEAVRELQVLSAPYDVRFGNFAGGLINAVTRSGGNRFEGSVFGYYQNRDLSGADLQGIKGPARVENEAGFTFGGPLLLDRLAFFLAGDLQRRVEADPGVVIGTDPTGGADSAGIGVTYASYVRFRDILKKMYGVDAGGIELPDEHNPAENLFAKITAQLGVNSRLELSHNYVHASAEGNPPHDPYGGYRLTSSGFIERTTTHATRLTWNAGWRGRISNELTLGRLQEEDRCQANALFARLVVFVDEGSLVAGSQAGCSGSYQIQRIVELTDNLAWSVRDHQITIGTHDEFIRLPGVRRKDFLERSNWTFSSLDSLEHGVARTFLRAMRGPEKVAGPLSDLGVNQFGFYAQDAWAITPRLTLTGGVRLDVPFMSSAPTHNAALQTALGIDNSITPSGNPLWSPRLGFSWNIGRRGQSFLRGGVGLFAGRPAYRWFNAAYVHTGLEEVDLSCSGSAVPPFTPNLAEQPTTCGSGPSPSSLGGVNVFDSHFRFPRYLKVSLGIDRRLPGEVVASTDLLYTRGVNQFYLDDLNLRGPAGTAAGEGGRVLYGTIDEDGTPNPSRLSDAFGQVIRIRNARGDHSLSLSLQLQKRFGSGEVRLGYTHTSASDRLSASEEFLFFDLAATPLEGTLAERTTATSLSSVPHKLVAVGTADLPFHLRGSVVYLGNSGPPFTYVLDGDANADGMAAAPFFVPNDIIYVPRDANDISLADPSQFAALDRYIRNEPCLESQRGRIMRRNSCRGGWSHTMNARFSRVFPTLRGRAVELTVDLFNALAMARQSWGTQHRLTDYSVSYHDVSLLSMVGYDQAHSRGIYDFTPPTQTRVYDPWRIQLGARLTF
jgi:carboxypeptidase family protein/TonB-dependent receptor-like protein